MGLALVTAVDASTVNSALAAPDVHLAAVGEDEGDVAVEGDGAGVIDVAVYDVGSCRQRGHGLVERDGLDVFVQCAVGFDIRGGDRKLREYSTDGDVGIGHGQGIAVGVVAGEGAAAGGVGAAVAFALGVGERQAHLVFVASVEHIAVFQAFQLRLAILIGGDAADGVLGRRTAEGDGDILARRDGAGLLALGGAQQAGVVAVGACRAVAHEGGAGVLLASGCADGAEVGGQEAVGHVDGGVPPAHEAAALVGLVALCALDAAVEEASCDVGGAARPRAGHDAAVGAVAVDAADDVDRRAAVGDVGRAVSHSDDAAGVDVLGVDVARDVQVLDSGVVDIAERREVVLIGRVAGLAVVEGQRVALSVERAAEGAIAVGEVTACAAARHAGDGVLSRADVRA